MTMAPPAELAAVRAGARCLATMADVHRACDAMAASITARLATANPLLLCVMTVGAMPLGLLLERLDFPLQLYYVHLARDGLSTSGGDMTWGKRAAGAIRVLNRCVVYDMLDRGHQGQFLELLRTQFATGGN